MLGTAALTDERGMSERAEHYGKFLNAALALRAQVSLTCALLKGEADVCVCCFFALAYSALISTLTTQTQVMPFKDVRTFCARPIIANLSY